MIIVKHSIIEQIVFLQNSANERILL